MTNFYEMQKNFLLNEGSSSPDMDSYIQAIDEALASLTPSSMRDQRRIAIAKENLKNIKSRYRRFHMEYQEVQSRLLEIENSEKNKE